MLRPTFLTIGLFFFIKYFVFYIFMMFKNKNYSLINIYNMNSAEDLFYYLWTFLFLPIVSFIFFSLPIYFSFKVSNRIYFPIIIGAVLVAEYFVYTYLASPSDCLNGVFNTVIGIMFFFLLFYRATPSYQ